MYSNNREDRITDEGREIKDREKEIDRKRDRKGLR